MSATHNQLLARLHAEGRKRGLTHEDLRAVAGVESLSTASWDQLSAAVDRVAQRHSPPRPAARRPRLAPGVIRPASDRQRAYIADLLAQTGWPADSQAHWLWQRHRLRIVATDPLSSTTAHAIITQLEQVARKRRASPDPAVLP